VIDIIGIHSSHNVVSKYLVENQIQYAEEHAKALNYLLWWG